ncbi:MAG TPA: sugar phosphate isomerase/epimerase [bacterium]|nr:sugar phosphate isomerase/epimerase [bacterium]HNS49266.1 sugar phosphate isomerase/epimerase [bacterium]
MADFKLDLAVQSYTFRGFKDNTKVAGFLNELGLKKIELYGAHASPADPAAFAAAVETYRKAGVEVGSIGVYGFGDQAEKNRPIFEAARKAAIPLISADFELKSFPNCIRVAGEMAREYGIKLAVHNHGARHWLGSAQMLSHFFGLAGPEIGLCLDTAWALDSREDPLAMITAFKERLYAIHLKDFLFDSARKPQDVVVGTGNLDLKALFAKLAEAGFSGPAVLEYEGDVEDPRPALKKAIEAIAAAVK